MKDLKYLFAYTVPISVYISFISTGIWTYSSVFYTFIIIPLLDLVVGETKKNLSDEDISYIKNKWIFDLMLYLNFPIVFGLLYFFLFKIHFNQYEVYEFVGLAISCGILLATNAINVAHELGHRKPLFDRLLSQALYIPCLYMHFFIEHNYGHHLKVATPEDPATAKLNQSVYSFWFTSVTRQYISAWKIQLQMLKRDGLHFFSLKNKMIFYHIIQALYLLGVYSLFSIKGLWFAVVVGVIAFLFLECINYIEHYGLRRFKNKSGRYERIQLHHSWNSNYSLGRITLYELTRHSDHHYKSSKKYQTLKSYEESPTLPLGYPASILLSFIPPLWYWVMNPRVPDEMKFRICLKLVIHNSLQIHTNCSRIKHGIRFLNPV
jgi:alkane 1-monooxygenase